MGFFEIFATALSGFYAFAKSYGVAIILLTLLVRLILLPLSIKQTKSMREMQRIQPEIKKIQAKHKGAKGDKQKQNEEMMALYKEHGVNPFGGCLPIVMQFPFLIGLFYVIRDPLKYMADTALASDLTTRALETHQFLGLRLDCTSQRALGGQGSDTLQIACGSGFASALPYLVLVLLMGFTTWYQQRQMMASRGAADNPQAQQMQIMAKIMPIMLMVFAFNFPSGVVLYWITTNLWTIGQQRIILRTLPPVAGDASDKGASTGKSSPSGKPLSSGKTAPLPKEATAPKEGARNGSRQAKPSAHSKKKKKR